MSLDFSGYPDGELDSGLRRNDDGFLLLRIQILSRYPGGSRGPMVRPYSLLSVVSDLMLATKGMNRYTLI
jgi:hypothetical protein